jgi:hypothetical protein
MDRQGDILDYRTVEAAGFNYNDSSGIMSNAGMMNNLNTPSVSSVFGFEDPAIEQMIEDIASFIKREYKKVTGSALSLTKVGEVDAMVQNTSRVRTWVQAKCFYDLGGLDDSTEGIKDPSEDRLEDSFRKFLEQDAGDTKAKNDKRKAPTPGQPVYAGKGKVHARKDVNSTYKAE